MINKLICVATILVSAIVADAYPASEHRMAVSAERMMIPLEDVRLTGGAFFHAQEMNRKWLRSLEPDRLLSGFRSEAGMSVSVPRYGGWESLGVTGHTLGHYLSAASMMYAATGDSILLKNVDYCVDVLDECQRNEGTGLLAGFEHSRELFDELRHGDIRLTAFDLNGGWVPFYTLHKEFAGLVDVCRFTHHQKALTVLTRFADWLCELTSNWDDNQMDSILTCEHGGMTEVLADVYMLTGNRKYLDLAQRFDHDALLNPLADGQDPLPGLHGNTQVPKIVGAMREYECTGISRYLTIASNFWHIVIDHHTYAIGGNSEHEHFGAEDMLASRLSDATCETCNTYNMLKLTKYLYCINPSVELVDYYERALYNQILASQNPDDGMVCYMSPLGSGYHKTFSNPFDSFWCCVGTGLENHAKYGEFIYAVDADANLYVNLYIPSDLDWKERGVKLHQVTDFPYSNDIVFEMELANPQSFTLNLRYPSWATEGCEVTVNGSRVATDARPGENIVIKRNWHSGDDIRLTLRQSIRTEAILGDSTVRAYCYGPLVLSAVLEDGEDIPAMVVDDLPSSESLIECTDAKRLRFMATSAKPSAKELIPYIEVGGRRMAVYFKHLASNVWQEQFEELRRCQHRDEWLRQRTVSQFTPGEMQPERDHAFRCENSDPHEFDGKKYRETTGGWMSFDMAVASGVPNTLYCTYWGDRFYNHKFDIEVDGVKVGFEDIHNWGAKYVERNYPIPQELTNGKESITVTLRAVGPDAVAGPLFDCRIMK